MPMKKIKTSFAFIFQFSCLILLKPLALLLYKNKYPWIICERGDDARDNGYIFYKFLRKERQFINAIYLIDKKSVDYPKVAKLGKVVQYRSFKHWLLYIAAEARFTTHLAAFAPANYIGEYYKHHKQRGINVFLQHGITHNEFPSNYYEHNGSDLFICGSKVEYDHIANKCNYPKGNVVYTGFARFDLLHDYETENQILVMPSWRSYLSQLSKEEFKQSKYFKAFDKLLKDNELNDTLSKTNTKLIFYIHYSLQPFVDCFTGYSNNIVIADFNHYDVQQLLKESKLLITDYSSIFFDFAYMKKPLLYYQFDVDEFYGKHYQRSYFDHARDGFGDVVSNHDELVSKILSIISNDYALNSEYLNRIIKFFPIYDTNNCKRIFDAVIDKYIDKFNKKKKLNSTTIFFTGDDYGRNIESTDGTNKAYELGYIQKASLMVNRSDSDLSHIGLIPNKDIVYHFNILEGYQSFDDTSIYAYSVNKDTLARRINNKKSFFKIDDKDKKIIEKELIYQIKKFKELGYTPIRFDSHGHSHNKLPIANIIIPILKQEGFKETRIPANMMKSHLLFDLTYKKYVTHLYRKSFATYDYFGSCYDLLHTNLAKHKYNNKTIEIMTHPFMDNGQLINRRDIDFTSLTKMIK